MGPGWAYAKRLLVDLDAGEGAGFEAVELLEVQVVAARVLHHAVHFGLPLVIEPHTVGGAQVEAGVAGQEMKSSPFKT